MSRRPAIPFAGLLVLLAAAEIAWFAWFVALTLPNAGRNLSRWQLALVALPGIASPSTIGSGLSKLSRVEWLPQRLPILASAAWIGAGAIGIGYLILRALRLRDGFGKAERLAIAFGLGVAALGALALIAGRLGWLSPWPARIALALPVVAESICRFARRPGSEPTAWRWPSMAGLLLVATPFLVPALLSAMLPTIDYDALEYHLQGPKEYFQNGRISFLPHNVYTSMPFGVEMLHLLGMHVSGDWWTGALAGQVLIWAHAPMSAILLASTATRWATPRAGWVAAVAYLATPWIFRMASLPYVEGPLCYQHAALIALASRAWDAEEGPAGRLWAAVGLMAGSSLATKYPALISAVIPFSGLAMAAASRLRSPSIAARFGVGVLLIAGPWLAKNLVDHGNPVYPLAGKIFGGSPWSPAREAQWSAAHGPKAITAGDILKDSTDVAGRSDWQSPLYGALGPLALLRRGSRRRAAALMAYVGYIFLTWWLFTHRLDRFWLPMLPGLAILAGLGADWTPRRAWSLILVPVVSGGVFLGLAHSWTDLTAFNDWTADLTVLRSSVPRMLNPALKRLDDMLPPDARPLLVGQAAVFPMNHPIAYNTVFDDDIFESIAKGRTPEQVREELARRGITHIYLDQFEVDRHRKPGGYGFTDFVQPAEFGRLVDAGVLGPARILDDRGERLLYEVLPAR
ncbi:MAG: hypothetical protein U0800_11770 [Isosphaeraceae bacterium]